MDTPLIHTIGSEFIADLEAAFDRIQDQHTEDQRKNDQHANDQHANDLRTKDQHDHDPDKDQP